MEICYYVFVSNQSFKHTIKDCRDKNTLVEKKIKVAITRENKQHFFLVSQSLTFGFLFLNLHNTTSIALLIFSSLLRDFTWKCFRSCHPRENGGEDTEDTSDETGNPITDISQPRQQFDKTREVFLWFT